MKHDNAKIGYDSVNDNIVCKYVSNPKQNYVIEFIWFWKFGCADTPRAYSCLRIVRAQCRVNPSISKHCYDATDHKLSRIKISCGALSTLTDFFFAIIKYVRSYFLYIFMLLFKPHKTCRHSSLTRHSPSTPQLNWPNILRSFDSIKPLKQTLTLAFISAVFDLNTLLDNAPSP